MRKVKSPISGFEYNNETAYKSDIEVLEFARSLRDDGVKTVGVIGLGFVGAATATMVGISEQGYGVLGFDVPTDNGLWKIGDFNNGIVPISCGDEHLSNSFSVAFSKNKMQATPTLSLCSMCDVVIVAINLDVEKVYSDDGELTYDVVIQPYLECIKEIAKYISQDTLIILEFTLPVGFTEGHVLPILQDSFVLRGLDTDAILLGHSYERVTPGKNYLASMKNFYRVYSGVNEISKIKTRQFLETVISTEDFPLTELPKPAASEMAKLLENSYRSMNIAFAIEWSRFAEENLVNLYEVVDAIRMRPTHANLMYPGIGVGGYCLTKDGLIAASSFQSGELPMTVNALKQTDLMPRYAVDYVKAHIEEIPLLKSKECIFAGVSYAPGVGDTRYSPVQPFFDNINHLFNKCHLVDPYVSFWEETNNAVSNSLDELNLENVEYVFICTKHPEFIHIFDKLDEAVKSRIHLFDLVGLYQNSENIKKSEQFEKYFLLGGN